MSVLIFNSRVFSKDSEWTASQWYLQFSIKLRLFSVETYSSIQQLNWKFSSDTTLSYFLSVFHVIVYFSSVLHTVQVILRFILWSDHLRHRHVDAGCQDWLILVLLWHKHPEHLMSTHGEIFMIMFVSLPDLICHPHLTDALDQCFKVVVEAWHQHGNC